MSTTNIFNEKQSCKTAFVYNINLLFMANEAICFKLHNFISGSDSIKAKPRPQTHFLHIVGHRTFLVERKLHFQLSSAA